MGSSLIIERKPLSDVPMLKIGCGTSFKDGCLTKRHWIQRMHELVRQLEEVHQAIALAPLLKRDPCSRVVPCPKPWTLWAILNDNVALPTRWAEMLMQSLK